MKLLSSLKLVLAAGAVLLVLSAFGGTTQQGSEASSLLGHFTAGSALAQDWGGGDFGGGDWGGGEWKGSWDNPYQVETTDCTAELDGAIGVDYAGTYYNCEQTWYGFWEWDWIDYGGGEF